jgi:lysyl-tRNA synthetase class II
VYHCHDGVISLSQITQAPIIPISYDLSHKITLKKEKYRDAEQVLEFKTGERVKVAHIVKYINWQKDEATAYDSIRKAQDDLKAGAVFEAVAEPHLIQPTFIYDYPTELSPLSKTKPEDPETVERFELYIGGMEIANAFSELRDPEEQEKRFQAGLSENFRVLDRQRGRHLVALAHDEDGDYVLRLHGRLHGGIHSVNLPQLTCRLAAHRSAPR